MVRGEEIRKILIAAGGDLKKMELRIKKRLEKSSKNKIWGRYVTRLFLEKEGWDNDMIEASRTWANERGLLRVSEVHKKEEWKIPLEESFSFKNELKESAEVEGVKDVEDCHH